MVLISGLTRRLLIRARPIEQLIAHVSRGLLSISSHHPADCKQLAEGLPAFCRSPYRHGGAIPKQKHRPSSGPSFGPWLAGANGGSMANGGEICSQRCRIQQNRSKVEFAPIDDECFPILVFLGGWLDRMAETSMRKKGLVSLVSVESISTDNAGCYYDPHGQPNSPEPISS